MPQRVENIRYLHQVELCNVRLSCQYEIGYRINENGFAPLFTFTFINL